MFNKPRSHNEDNTENRKGLIWMVGIDFYVFIKAVIKTRSMKLRKRPFVEEQKVLAHCLVWNATSTTKHARACSIPQISCLQS